MKKFIYSQTRIKETHWAVRKEFLLSIVSSISCPINVESLTCIKSEEWKRFLHRMFRLSVFLLSEFDCNSKICQFEVLEIAGNISDFL